MAGFLRELLQTIALALLLFLVLQAVFKPSQVMGNSMEPTLQPGERVLVNKLVYLRLDVGALARAIPLLPWDEDLRFEPFHSPRRGEIVVFRFPMDPSRDFIKRVIAGPGDTVEMRRGKVLVNGKLLEESYIQQNDPFDLAPTLIPPDRYFVLGDNRRISMDSRDWGLVPRENIVGKAWLVYWPLLEMSMLSSPAYK